MAIPWNAINSLFEIAAFAPESHSLEHRLKVRAGWDRQGGKSERQQNKLDLAEKQKSQFVICLSNNGQQW